MRKSAVCPLLALALGAAAALLRMWQQTAGYDAGGLPVFLSPPTEVLTVFLIACAVLFLLLGLRQPKALGDQKTAAPQGELASLLLAASGILLLAGGAFNLMSVANGYLEVSSAVYSSAAAQKEAMRGFLVSWLLPLALAVVSVPAAIALLYRAKRAKGEPEEKPGMFAVLMPPLFCWVWLIEVYRQHTANPIVWDYVLLLFAVIALLLSGYDRAGFAFGAGKPRRAVFLSLLALFFAVAALPDSGGPANAVTLAAVAVQTVAELTALLHALEHAPAVLDTKRESIQQEDVPHE